MPGTQQQSRPRAASPVPRDPGAPASRLPHGPAGPIPSARAACLPLVLGITGHRDLRDEDIPGLEAAVKAIFADLQARCPNTPLMLLSPLAEGADRLAARVALDMGVRLVVPLPMPRQLYLDDFSDP